MSFCNSEKGSIKLEENLGADPPGFIPGKMIHISPFNQKIELDIYGPLGKPSGILFGLLFQLNKWGYVIEKLEESVEISPVHPQYYQLTVQQKQQLEGQIKTAMGSISNAVSDYELVAHDLRKYTEYMRYFEEIEVGKKEKKKDLIMKNLQTFRSIFIDQVDVFTGEGVALKLIAPRWPTIIVDFMRLDEDDTDQKKISKRYEVTEAEGVVLATKNKLFLQWKDMFKQTVKERYENLKRLAEARKKSIEEYREMVKPYISRYRTIREMTETAEGRLANYRAWFKPSVQGISLDSSEYWAWKPFAVPEFHKAPQIGSAKEKMDILGIPFPESFKQMIRNEWKQIPDKFKKLEIFPTSIEPLDRWVMHFLGKMEENYNVKLSAKEILEVREKFANTYNSRGWTPTPYFVVVEIEPERTVMRFPDGGEGEDITFFIRAVLDSQNTMLLRYLEMKLKDIEFERYISEFLGETVRDKLGVSRGLRDILKEEFPLSFSEIQGLESGKDKKNIVEKIRKISDFERRTRFFMRGPYEVNFIDRVTAPYFKTMAADIYAPVVRFIKNGAGVP